MPCRISGCLFVDTQFLHDLLHPAVDKANKQQVKIIEPHWRAARFKNREDIKTGSLFALPQRLF
jgi:hypothetical protein